MARPESTMGKRKLVPNVDHAISDGKKQKLSCDDLLCPISKHLPVDPVLAEDGWVYERALIEKWLKEKHKSPVANVPMGVKLQPLRRTKDHIEQLVKQGVIDDELARDWTERNTTRERELAEQKKEREKLMAEAARGANETAHIKLALALERGDHGFRKSIHESMRELQRGAEKGLTTCMLFLGLFKLRSSSTSDVMAGMHWLTAAAHAHNASACMILGIAFAADKSKLPECFTACAFVPAALHTMATKSDAMATQWFDRALKERADVAGRRLQDHHVKAVQKWLGPRHAATSSDPTGSAEVDL